jgi:hypothetical protein
MNDELALIKAKIRQLTLQRDQLTSLNAQVEELRGKVSAAATAAEVGDLMSQLRVLRQKLADGDWQ